MRRLSMLAAATALFAAVALMSSPSQAATLGAPAAVNGAAATLNPIEKAACWRYGWHGWGWYPCVYRVYPYRYWGWRHPYWGYRRWGWRRWHYSDVQLKHDVAPVGHLANGLNLYRFSYNGSDKVYVGVMAQEVARVMPDAVRRGRDGYLQVDYDRVGVPMMTWSEWVAAGERH